MRFCFGSRHAVLIEYGFPEVDDLSGDTQLESDFCWLEACVEHFKGTGSAFFELGFGQTGWGPGHGGFYFFLSN